MKTKQYEITGYYFGVPIFKLDNVLHCQADTKKFHEHINQTQAFYEIIEQQCISANITFDPTEPWKTLCELMNWHNKVELFFRDEQIAKLKAVVVAAKELTDKQEIMGSDWWGSDKNFDTLRTALNQLEAMRPLPLAIHIIHITTQGGAK